MIHPDELIRQRAIEEGGMPVSAGARLSHVMGKSTSRKKPVEELVLEMAESMAAVLVELDPSEKMTFFRSMYLQLRAHPEFNLIDGRAPEAVAK